MLSTEIKSQLKGRGGEDHGHGEGDEGKREEGKGEMVKIKKENVVQKGKSVLKIKVKTYVKMPGTVKKKIN